jgi:magnesium transporter
MTYEGLEQYLSEEVSAGAAPQGLKDFLEEEHAADLAQFLEEYPVGAIWRALELLPLERQAAVFGYFPVDVQVGMAEVARRSQLPAIMSEMDSDDRADLFNNLSDEQRETLLPALSSAEREDIRRLAGHAEGTAGALMTSDYASLSPEITAAEALEKLRQEAPDKETIYRAYVINESRKLVGSVRLQQIILAQPREKISEIMETNTHAVMLDESQEEVARQISKYDILALPVVDNEHRLVGIVTYDDALDVLEDEATEDFHKAATIGKLDQGVSDASVFLLYQKRVYWLVILVFGNILSGAGLVYFEDTLLRFISLAFFLPLLMGSAGNAGSQSATLIIRALATGDIETGDWFKMLMKELFVAFLLGFTLAVVVSGLGVFKDGLEIALVVGMTMVSVIIFGSLLGVSMPFVLKRFGFDPATASGPLITSISDFVGVVIYFSIAAMVLL